MKASTKYSLGLVCLVFLGGVFSSCSSNTSEKDNTETELELKAPKQLIVTTEQFEASNMELTDIQTKVFSSKLKANGMFEVPPQNRVSVSTYFGGYVRNVELLTGQRVEKGQLLFRLENPEFVKVQQEFLEIRSELDFIKRDFERQGRLVTDKVSSQKDYERASSDYNSIKAKYQSLKKQLELMGIAADQLEPESIQSQIEIRSPLSAYVTEVNINKGLFVSPSDVAVSLVNTDHLHLELQVFEKDLSKIQIGQSIRFRIQNSNDQLYNASVYLINKSVDPNSRSILVHCHLEDEEKKQPFSPGMFAEAQILLNQDSLAALPEDAIVKMDGVNYVLELLERRDSNYVFVQKELNAGRVNDSYIEVLNLNDFKKQSMILSKGAFNLIHN